MPEKGQQKIPQKKGCQAINPLKRIISEAKNIDRSRIKNPKSRSISIKVKKACRSGVAPTAPLSNCDYCQNHAIYRKIYILIVIWSISQTEYKGWILLFLMPSLSRVQWIGNWVKWPLQSEWMHIVVSKKMPSHKNISNISKWRHHMLFRDVYPIFC